LDMTKAKIILASVAAIALFPAMASAQHAPEAYSVLNGQVQLNDVMANLHVQMGEANGITGSNLAAGNNMAARAVQNDMTVESTQELNGNVTANNYITAGSARDLTLSTAVAHGNVAQVEGCCANTNTAVTQTTAWDRSITANSLIQVGSADAIVSATQATANTFGGWTANGSTTGYAGQFNASTVNSNSVVEACCNNHSVTSGAVAAANSARWAGENATIYGAVDQKNYADSNAHSRVSVGSATNVTSAAASAGNLAEIQNKWGYAQLDGFQGNSGNINASSVVQLGDWGGYAVSGANAIANSALVSNLGSDVTMSMQQNNHGNVTAFGMLEGNSSRGGVGVVSSMATGNAMTGYACASCGSPSVKVEGYATQNNWGNVTAATYVGVGTAGPITASATAIGNTATFIAQRSH
jgi:hypothetical protein